jgi:hypothetical protein
MIILENILGGLLAIVLLICISLYLLAIHEALGEKK